jgi:hypothetical protein
MFELEPQSESLTWSLLEGLEGTGRKGEKGTKLIVSFLILWPSYWAFTSRSAAKNG